MTSGLPGVRPVGQRSSELGTQCESEGRYRRKTIRETNIIEREIRKTVTVKMRCYFELVLSRRVYSRQV